MDRRFNTALDQLLYLVRPVNSSASPSLTHSPVELARCFSPSAYIKLPLDFEYSVATSLDFQAIAPQDAVIITIKLASSSHLPLLVAAHIPQLLGIEADSPHLLLN